MPRSTTKTATKTADSNSQSTREPVPAWELFVPDSTRENYLEMARDIAATEGCTGAEALEKLAKGFDTQHEADPAAGWGHLADWARSVGDPGDGAAGDLSAQETARAVESARRDPREALRGSDEAVKAAEEELARRGVPQQLANADGVIPNTGPAEDVHVPSSADGDDED